MSAEAVAVSVPARGLDLAEEMLTLAGGLLKDGWCQGHTAVDNCGRPVAATSAFACRWSATGALERVWARHEDRFGAALDAFERANLALSSTVGTTPQAWNDAETRTLTEILDAFADAVQLVKGPSVGATDRPFAD